MKSIAMPNRGLTGAIIAGLDNWRLPQTFTADHIAPHVAAKYPGASHVDIQSTLWYIARERSEAKLRKLSRGVYVRTGANVVGTHDIDVIDEVLTALAKAEGLLRQYKSLATKLHGVRTLLNGDGGAP